MSDLSILDKPKEQLEREEAVRQALEQAACKIEALNVNSVYRQALKKATRIIRDLKP